MLSLVCFLLPRKRDKNVVTLAGYFFHLETPVLPACYPLSFSVCPLMPSCNTYCLTWVSLTLDVGYLFTTAPAKRSRCPYLGRGVSPHGRLCWPWTWSSSSQPSCDHAATTPWMWGCSSWLLPLTLGVGKFLSATPAPSQPGALGRCLWPRKWAWWLLKPLEPAYWVANCFRC